MKILLVNGNRTRSVTDTVLAEARQAALPDTELTAVTATFGADIVFGHAEDAIAGHAVLDSLARHYSNFDAAVLAISFDSGLLAARDLLAMPVLGITESALLTACTLGQRVGVVSVGRVSDALYAEVFARSGVAARIAGRRTIDLASTGEYLSPTGFDARVAAAANDLAAADRADVVVICGAALAGIARRLRDAVAVPVLDGVACAVRHAEARVRAGERNPPRAPGPVARVEGVSPQLAALFARG